jgi:hypothetical protein
MTEVENPFSGLDLQEAIDLRWTLRDKRWAMFPVNPSHQENLIAMSLVEMRDGVPSPYEFRG